MKAMYAILAAAGVLAFGASASPALGTGFTLNLSASSTPVVGTPMELKVTGTVPPENVTTPYFLSLDVLPAAAATTCPADQAAAAELVAGTGGTVLVNREPEDPDAGGDFATAIGVRPTGAGRVLLCAYLDDGGSAALAGAALALDIRPAPATGRRATIPEEARAGMRAAARCSPARRAVSGA
jgi:hypothetical protein